MKNTIIAMIGLLMLIPSPAVAGDAPAALDALKAFLAMPVENREVAFFHLGRYSNIIVRVGQRTVLFDPARLFDDAETAAINAAGVDLVLYTHEHSDHFSSITAAALFSGSQPHFIVEPFVAKMLKGDIPDEKLILAESGKSIAIGGMTVDAIAGDHLGPIMLYRVTINGISFFHGGDSAYVPLQSMQAHVAFVPTGSPSPTCKPEYAVRMVSDIKPQIAVPMHGWEDEHAVFRQRMKEAFPDVAVKVCEPAVGMKVAIR